MLGMISLVIVAIVAGWETRAWWRERRAAAERREREAYVREAEFFVIAQEVAARRREADAERPYPLVARKVVVDEVTSPEVAPLDEANFADLTVEVALESSCPSNLDMELEDTREIDPEFLARLRRAAS